MTLSASLPIYTQISNNITKWKIRSIWVIDCATFGSCYNKQTCIYAIIFFWTLTEGRASQLQLVLFINKILLIKQINQREITLYIFWTLITRIARITKKMDARAVRPYQSSGTAAWYLFHLFNHVDYLFPRITCISRIGVAHRNHRIHRIANRFALAPSGSSR